jgi:hypothetical protein
LCLYSTFSPKIKALWSYKAAIQVSITRKIAALVKIAHRPLWFRQAQVTLPPKVFMPLTAMRVI